MADGEVLSQAKFTAMVDGDQKTGWRSCGPPACSTASLPTG